MILPRPPATLHFAAPRARHHALRDLAAIQEAAEAGHLPDLVVLARGLFEDAGGHVGADVEDHRLDRADVALDLVDQRDHRLFVASIRGVGARLAAGLAYLVDERRELVGAAPRHAGD